MESYEKMLEIIKEGDLIECISGPVRHWAVYIGRIGSTPYVVHRVGKLSTGEDTGVKQCALRELFGNRECWINNYMDGRTNINDPQKTVDRAMSKVGKDNEYDVVFNNCEHFAKWCRYGEATSEQVKSRALRAACTTAAVVSHPETLRALATSCNSCSIM